MKTIINIIKGIIKLPIFLVLFLFFFPLIIFSLLEDLGSNKKLFEDGFFSKLARRFDDFIYKIMGL